MLQASAALTTGVLRSVRVVAKSQHGDGAAVALAARAFDVLWLFADLAWAVAMATPLTSPVRVTAYSAVVRPMAALADALSLSPAIIAAVLGFSNDREHGASPMPAPIIRFALIPSHCTPILPLAIPSITS